MNYDQRLYEIRKQYTEMLYAKIDALRAENAVDEAQIEQVYETRKLIDASGVLLGDNSNFGYDLIGAAFRRINVRNEKQMELLKEIRDGMHKKATPEIVEIVTGHNPLDAFDMDGVMGAVDWKGDFIAGEGFND